MVTMKGSTRVFDKPLEEQTGSTSQLKLLSVYGITSYDDLVYVPLEIRSSTSSDKIVNININNLGLKSLTFGGSAKLPASWNNLGSTYRIMYTGTYFVLLGSVSFNTHDINILPVSSNILNLTNSSTALDIQNAFGSQTLMSEFIESIETGDTIYCLMGSSSVLNYPGIFLPLYINTYSFTDSSVDYNTDTISLFTPSDESIIKVNLTRESGTYSYISVNINKTDLKSHSYTITTSTIIPENVDYLIPCNYKVGACVLDVYYMGEKLIKGVHYIEVGNNNSISNKIQFYNWGQSVPSGTTIEFIVRGVYD